MSRSVANKVAAYLTRQGLLNPKTVHQLGAGEAIKRSKEAKRQENFPRQAPRMSALSGPAIRRLFASEEELRAA